MVKTKSLTLGVVFIFIFLAAFTGASGQVGADKCELNGTYRIDVTESDKLYSVVRRARSNVPFADQQQFFMDLSTRLTPPDMLAIECNGRRVSVGSSRAERVTYLADGRNRRERLSNGSFVDSKITLRRGLLTFVAVGDAEDNVDVSFQSLEDGQRMLVTRRIFAKQLPEPIVIRTYYDKISPAVEWRLYDADLVARSMPTPARKTPVARADSGDRGRADILREKLVQWIDATNRRDIDEQMRFYVPQLRAYYLTRNTPIRAVRLEKERIFGAARAVDIRIGEPEIVFQDGGKTAIMRFEKEYRLTERGRVRQGKVVQELRWRDDGDGWRIFSERDVRVLR